MLFFSFFFWLEELSFCLAVRPVYPFHSFCILKLSVSILKYLVKLFVSFKIVLSAKRLIISFYKQTFNKHL